MLNYNEMTLVQKAQELRCSIGYNKRLLASGSTDAFLPGKIAFDTARLRSFEARIAKGEV